MVVLIIIVAKGPKYWFKEGRARNYKAIAKSQKMAKNGEQNMRKILLAAAFSITATSLHAGSMATPKMEEPVVSASSSSAGATLPILLMLVLGVLVSQ